MGEISLKHFDSYVDFVNAWILQQPKKGYGVKGELANYLGVNTSYISQILSGSLKLTEEHAIKLVRFFKFNEIEADYFLTLVALDRAGNKDLEKYYRQKLKDYKTELNKVIPDRESSEKESLDRYFANWLNSALHIALSIKPMNIKELSQFSGQATEKVQIIVEFLHKNGYLDLNEGRYSHSKENITLTKGSKLLGIHHSNWRFRSMEQAQISQDKNLHYTSIISCSRDDGEKIMEMIRELISEVRTVTKDSNDEDVFCFTTDFFKVFDNQ